MSAERLRCRPGAAGKRPGKIMIDIGGGVSIAENELVFKFSRSSGPGGQNINKVNTRVTVFFDAAGTKNLSDAQKKLILKKLATYADKRGVIRVVSQRHRTQKANREAAVEKLRGLLKKALKKKKVRKKTKVPESAKRRRLEGKRRRSILKKQRSEKDFDF